MGLFSGGLVYGIFQYILYHKFLERYGLFGTLKLSAILGIPIAFITPIATTLNRGEPSNEISVSSFIFLITLSGSTRVFTIMYYGASSVGGNEAVKPEELAIFNGISMLGGSVAQAVGPVLAGFVTSFALSSGVFRPHIGVYIAFIFVSLIGVGLTIFTCVSLKRHYIE